MKQKQVFSAQNTIPPLIKTDGTTAVGDKDNTELLASHISSKVSVPDLSRQSPEISSLTKASLEGFTDTKEEVKSEKSPATNRPKKALG